MLLQELGHRYNIYYYTFLHNGNYYTIKYDASTIECGVYGEESDPGFQNCLSKTKTISLLISLIDKSVSTLEFN
jgi:hypothetical protein